MYKTIFKTLLALSLCLFGLSALAANDIEPGKEFYTVIRAPNPIVLDGNLSEWAGVPVLADPKFSTPKGSGPTNGGTYVLFEEYNGGTWTGPDDQTSAVQVTYDLDNVYFGFVVTDDYHENSANSAWNGDSVQLMIANADRTAQVALYNYALGGVETNLGTTIIMEEAGPGGTTAVVTRNTTTKRTTYEIKLPKASLGLTDLTNGTQFGLGMAINDGDLLTPGQKGWGGLGAHAIVFGKTPQETALMTLKSYNDIEPG
ncbi:MAG TPA: sugar-binding protein, partial [Verrucomicrobiae bacterium]|nr:sugar-binding protein [Verrucomicrobiae bacterium]